ncbi:MAG TPA: ABC transporter substrate-binding protein [Gammaproteobacteria bacterium]|nr:ABC transporter substrate-binding protein [Gammaproteobacteria bacterium]
MRQSIRAIPRTLAALAVVTASLLALSAPAQAAGTIRVGVIAPKAMINGRAIFQGAQLAAKEINAAGGINGKMIKLYEYDDHASATEGVRDFQRAAQRDHAIAVLGNFTSEVAMAVQPWSGRLKEPYIITGAATTKIPQRTAAHYDEYKYVFRVNLNSAFLAKSVCAASHDILVKQLHYKTAVEMSEDAAWTKPLDAEYLKCLPKAGLKVLDHIRFDPDTTDFSPIFSRIAQSKPDVIITGIAHVGVKPTVQWHQKRVPALLAGWSSQAGTTSFWDDTNGATNGVITGNLGATNAAITPKTKPFAKAYQEAFNESPAYDAYTTYDAMYILKAAIERANSTNNDKLVEALEKTDHIGTIGREVFYQRGSKYVHDLKYGKDYVPGVAIQWQNGKQVILWPEKAATGKVMVPDFVKKGWGS